MSNLKESLSGWISHLNLYGIVDFEPYRKYARMSDSSRLIRDRMLLAREVELLMFADDGPQLLKGYNVSKEETEKETRDYSLEFTESSTR